MTTGMLTFTCETYLFDKNNNMINQIKHEYISHIMVRKCASKTGCSQSFFLGDVCFGTLKEGLSKQNWLCMIQWGIFIIGIRGSIFSRGRG